MQYIPANSVNWCELVNISSTYKELSLTVSTVEDPLSTTKVIVQPTQIDKQVIPQPIPNYAVVSPEVLGETVLIKLSLLIYLLYLTITKSINLQLQSKL